MTITAHRRRITFDAIDDTYVLGASGEYVEGRSRITFTEQLKRLAAPPRKWYARRLPKRQPTEMML